MGHYINNDGVLVTDTDNTILTNTETQVTGFEQFVSASSVKVVESLPNYTKHIQQFSHVVPIMTNNGHPKGGVYSSLTGDERINAYKVFSRDTSTSVRWETTTGWIKYDALEPIFITRYVITTPYFGDENSLPQSWKLLGSDDDRNWVVIDAEYYRSLALGKRYEFECVAPHSYRYIKFEWYGTKGNVGYSVLGTLDYYGVSRLGFEEYFDATMPVAMVHTEYQEELTHFPAVRRNKDYKYDADPFGDGSQLCYYTFDGTLEDVCGNHTLTANFSPSYVDIGDGHKALDYMSYNTGSYLLTNTALPLAGKEGITTCAWVKITHYNYGQWVNLWHIAGDIYTNTDRIQALWLYTSNTRSLYANINSNGSNLSYQTKKTMPIHKWAFVAMRQTKNSYDIMVDGKIMGGGTTYQTVDWQRDGRLYIGDRWHYKAYLMHDFRVFDRPLSDDELFTLQASGKTIAELKDKRMPLAYSLFDTQYKINGKSIPLTITNFEVVKERRKYRYIDYRMYSGSSLNNYAHITEIQALDELGNNVALNKPVVVYYSGNGNKNVITDGDLVNYYASNTSAAYVRIDLGEPKDIKYIQNWNYYNDNRTYNGIVISLTNNPSYEGIDSTSGYYDEVFSTQHNNRYIETVDGKISSNLHFDYSFKITYECREAFYPAEYALVTTIFYPRAGTRLYELFYEINRNLWHIKPRMLKSISETLLMEDKGHFVTPRKQVVSENIEGSDLTKGVMPPKVTFSEISEVGDLVAKVLTVGIAKSLEEFTSLFEDTSVVVAGSGPYSVIVHSISEEVQVSDFNTRYIRYNVCGRDAGVRVTPLDYIKPVEAVYFYFNKHPNKAVQLINTSEIITEIITIGTVGDKLEDVELQETVLAIIA